jgi:PAS domain S-box-containing protein
MQGKLILFFVTELPRSIRVLNLLISTSSFDGLFVIDDKGTILRVNQASCDVFGWSRNEFIGQNIKMIMPSGHSQKHDGYLSRYLKTGFKKMMGKLREVGAMRKDGSTFPCMLGLNEVVTNGSTQFVGFIRDVTTQKSLLLAQAEREASDSLLFNILPEHIAYRLKADPSHIADHYDNTTILFADIGE